MATAIQPFLDPEELEVLILYHKQQAIEANVRGHYEEEKREWARVVDLEKHRSISG